MAEPIFDVKINPSIQRFIEYLRKGPYFRESLQYLWEESGMYIVIRARENAPKDTGVLASNITFQVDQAFIPMGVKVGVLHNPGLLTKARAMEFGTGLLNDQGATHRHFPPGRALDDWAHRHGILSGFIVAKAIAKRGGLKPRRYMRRAFENFQKSVSRFLGQTEKKMEEKFKFP